MLPNNILLNIFKYLNNPFKLQHVSSQFKTLIQDNKNHIAHEILQRLGFKPEVVESYRIYKNYVSKHVINNINYDLVKAIKEKQLEVIELLLTDPKVDPSGDNNNAIRMAVEGENVETVKLLLADSRVDPSANDNIAIICASKKENIEIVKLLLTNEKVIRSSMTVMASSLLYESPNRTRWDCKTLYPRIDRAP